MNVLFITKGFPSDADPMTGNYEATQARAVARQGHKVTVIAMKWRSILFLFSKREIAYRKEGNIDIFEKTGIVPVIPKVFHSYKLNRWMMKRAFSKFCEQYLQEHPNPDIVHIHSQFIAKYAIVIKEKYGFPTVLTEHWSGLNDGKLDKNLQSEVSVYKIADDVIVVSKALYNALLRNYGIKSHVIHNMVDNQFFLNKKSTNKNGIFTFVSVGRLEPIKCFDALIKAYSKMNNHIQNTRLIIIGEGSESRRLHQLVKHLKIEDKVDLCGLKTPEEVAEILCEADCFVLSSHRETFGIVLIEAMAKGLPVICTRCGGPEDFVNESNGMLVEPDNPKELAKAMDYMVEHVYEYDNEAIRQFCANTFSEEKIAKQIVRIYKKVLYK